MQILTAVLIHIVTPAIGLIVYLQLLRRMRTEGIVNRPTVELFILFATYGGLLLITLTSLFWQWSGLASLGTFYLIIGAPVILGILAYRNRRTQQDSKYRKLVYQLSLGYYFLAPVVFGMLFFIENSF